MDLTFEGFEDNYIKIGSSHNPSNWCYGDLIWNDNNTLLVSQSITRSELREWMEECEVPTHVHHAVRGLVVRVTGG